jgi:hypothetical protein
MSSPTSRTKQLLEGIGWEVAIVEKYNSFTKRRFDLFEFADLLCIAHPRPPGGFVAVQATSGSNHAARRDKILSNNKALRFLQAGGHIWLVTWTKKTVYKADGTKAKIKRWAARTEIISEKMFNDHASGDTKAEERRAS